MTSQHPQPPLARTIGDMMRDLNAAAATFAANLEKSMADTMDTLRRTVSLVLPKPTETVGHQAVWIGEGWRVELFGDQINVTGGCAIGETDQVAAAMLAADRLRTQHTERGAES